MVNSTNCIKVAEQIENEPENFNLNSFFCRTQACIAGWCYLFYCEEKGAMPDKCEKPSYYVKVAEKYLGLSPGQGEKIFYPNEGIWRFKGEVSAQDAAEVLRQIADGTIDLDDVNP